MHACVEGHPNIVRELLKHDASLSKTHDTGKSPIDLAQDCGHDEVVDVILSFNRWDSRQYMIFTFGRNGLQHIAETFLEADLICFRDIFISKWRHLDISDKDRVYVSSVIDREREKVSLEDLLDDQKITGDAGKFVHVSCQCIDRESGVSGALYKKQEESFNLRMCFCKSCLSMNENGSLWVGMKCQISAWSGLENLSKHGVCYFCKSCGSKIFIRSSRSMLWIHTAVIHDSTLSKIAKQHDLKMDPCRCIKEIDHSDVPFVLKPCNDCSNVSCSFLVKTNEESFEPLLNIAKSKTTFNCKHWFLCLFLKFVIFLCFLLLLIWMKPRPRSKYAFH